MRFIWLFLLAITLPGAALSGAWPRTAGSTFLSFSQFTDMDDSQTDLGRYSSIYVEHGLTPDLTFGVDAGLSDGGTGKVLVFASRALDLIGPDWKLAVNAGLGARTDNIRTEPIVQFGLSLGRGFDNRLGSGWMALDSSATYRTASRGVVMKSDMTLGLSLGDATKIIVQFQAGKYPGNAAFLKLAPAVVRRIGPRMKIEVGAYANLAGTGNPGLKLGTWFEF